MPKELLAYPFRLRHSDKRVGDRGKKYMKKYNHELDDLLFGYNGSKWKEDRNMDRNITWLNVGAIIFAWGFVVWMIYKTFSTIN